MKPTHEAITILPDVVVSRVVELIRSDPQLGRDSFSSWEEVSPSDYEASERVRALIEEGAIPVQGGYTPTTILAALKKAEPDFWRTAD